MRRGRACRCVYLCVLFASLLPSVTLSAQSAARAIAVIPTIGRDHQFNLDYSVAHLTALLYLIRPDAILVDDNTQWLGRDCPLNSTAPEVHVALRFGRQNSVPVLGIRSWPPRGANDPFIASQQANESQRARVSDSTLRTSAREALQRGAASISRFTFSAEPVTLSQLLRSGFAQREQALTGSQRSGDSGTARRLADSLGRLMTENQSLRRWALLIDWRTAGPLLAVLQQRREIRLIPIDSFLPSLSGAAERQLDRTHLTWILSGNLDDWYGMWAPQAFALERVAALLRRLEQVAPQDAVTDFLKARWMMQLRDYAGAEPILRRLAELPPEVTFPFPINGKWIRPPWSSVRRKAQLNLAFVLDYRGQRTDALAIYHEILTLGDTLDAEARAFGYFYDDIQSAIRSYVTRPYTGDPDEAFRHLLSTVRRPGCEPK
jgi:tetratricopeptide (TPR) repeat protein